jgi:sulfite reductase (NADPH) flavoprotein alpha-component
MKLAEGRTVRLRMMAAMAQQDCGQCGSSCEEYSGQIFDKKEARLNLCVPGGKDTSRMLKKLYEEIGVAPAAPAAGAPAAPASAPAAEAGPTAAAAPGRSRDNPVTATVVSRTLLNKKGSEKETWHVEFDLTESGLEATASASFRPTTPAWSSRSSRHSTRRRTSRSAGARCARCSLTACRCRPRPTCCSSCSPT